MIQKIDEITNIPTFITGDFDEPVLYTPARTEFVHPCTSLKIITAFTDCERISTHMISLAEGIKNNRLAKGLSVEILLGMTKSSLSQKKHEDICRMIGFLNSSKGMPKISCRYICQGPEVHSKVYIWSTPDSEAGELPYLAFCGSLNYTMNAFYKRRESVSMCNSLEAFLYYRELLPDTIDCFDPDVSEKLKNVINNTSEAFVESDNSEKDYLVYDAETPVDTLTVSLLRADGSDTGYGSGINWGIRKNGTKRDQNQAYIPYNHHDKKSGFFPDRINPDDENCPMFKVITKDFGSFHMRMAQQGNKALHSVESNAILGEWIRKRIGAPSGGYVTKQKSILIKDDFTGCFDDAKLTLKFGKVRRKISLSEFSGLIAEYDITSDLEYFENGPYKVESLYALADEYALSFLGDEE